MSASSATAQATTASIGETTPQQQRGTLAFSNAYIGSPQAASVPLPKVESPESEEDAEPAARRKVAESPAEAAAAAASQEQLETKLTDVMKVIQDMKAENEAMAAKIKKLEESVAPGADPWQPSLVAAAPGSAASAAPPKPGLVTAAPTGAYGPC